MVPLLAWPLCWHGPSAGVAPAKNVWIDRQQRGPPYKPKTGEECTVYFANDATAQGGDSSLPTNNTSYDRLTGLSTQNIVLGGLGAMGTLP